MLPCFPMLKGLQNQVFQILRWLYYKNVSLKLCSGTTKPQEMMMAYHNSTAFLWTPAIWQNPFTILAICHTASLLTYFYFLPQFSHINFFPLTTSRHTFNTGILIFLHKLNQSFTGLALHFPNWNTTLLIFVDYNLIVSTHSKCFGSPRVSPRCYGNCKISQSVNFTSPNFATVLQLPLSFYDSKVGEKAMHVFFKDNLTTDMALITEPKLSHTLVHILCNYPFSVTIDFDCYSFLVN